MVIVDLDPPHEGADDVALAGPVRRFQPALDQLGEGFELADDEPEGPGLFGGILARSGFGLELAHPPSQLGEPRLELVALDQPLGIAVDEATDAAPELGELALGRLTLQPARTGPR
ncbi:MAG TPA: hypothetical protein VHK63_08310, partial [Candidatus Limnocylindria bacterium]|nr:hypothetical protein [Candidatus Limnocylindria bacterium]